MPSPAVTRDVGKIVIRHGHLDYVLRLTIKSLLKISIFDPLFKQETDKMSSMLRARIKELTPTKLAGHKDVLDELLAQIDRAEKLTELRNGIVHGVWARNKGGGAVKLRDTKNDKLHPMPTVKQLRLAERDIDELWRELNRSRLNGKLKQALL
jgi:hypothetical protein